jgi:hypothetical protein
LEKVIKAKRFRFVLQKERAVDITKIIKEELTDKTEVIFSKASFLATMS